MPQDNDDPLALPSDSEEIPTDADVRNSLRKIEALEQQIFKLQSFIQGKALTSDDIERNLRNEEIAQRIKLRSKISDLSIAVVIAMALLVLLGLYLVFCVTPLFGGKVLTVPSGYAIALYIAPLTSISAITVGLLVGAFRRFKDDDIGTMADGMLLEAAKKVSTQSG